MTTARRWSIPCALVLLGAVVVALAPAERTLGIGIRWVYVHVGLVWAGSVALGVAGLGGVAAAATGRTKIAALVAAAGRAGLLVFALGVAFSMVAARVNWGAVFLAEPRMAASLRFLAVAVILQVLASWSERPRVVGALAAATLGWFVADVGGAELVMHPRDPVRTASSAAIQATFAATFALASALTLWTFLRLRRRPTA